MNAKDVLALPDGSVDEESAEARRAMTRLAVAKYRVLQARERGEL